MLSQSRRVVITGMGVISPLGQDLDTVWQALCERRSGVRRLQCFDPTGFPVQIGGEVVDFNPRGFLDKKDRKRLSIMAPTFQFTAAASKLALDHAKITPEKLDPTRFGVVMGSSTVPGAMNDLGRAALVSADREKQCVDLKKWGAEGVPLVPPMWMLCHIPNMQACHVSIIHDAQGPNNTITQSEVAGLLALGEACRHIARDRADLFLAGAGDSNLTPINFARHCLFSPLSRRNDDPERASRPFEKWRDGWVLGEGAGVLAVEALQHAQARDADILAEVIGYSATFDPGCSGNGLVRAIRQALEGAGVRPADIDHINAQGNSSVEGDLWEARAIAAVFGADRAAPPVMAVKSFLGHLGAAGSPVELVISLLALEYEQVPAMLNCVEPDPDCPVRVLREPKPLSRPCFLKVAFTEMGHCAAAVIRKWQ